MPVVKETEAGLGHLHGVLKEKARTVTRVAMWGIPHRRAQVEDVCLKVGRYTRDAQGLETPEQSSPKSELTLDNEEFSALIRFLQENNEPFRAGVKSYVALDNATSEEELNRLKVLFSSPHRKELIDLLVRHDLIPQDLILGVQHRLRVRAVDLLVSMLKEDRKEDDWQRWFKENDWVFGSDYVRVLDDRYIDVGNIADYLVEAYDGFLDIIEIKRPGPGVEFWAATLDHGNYVPHSDLTKALAQVTNYLFEVEREANSVKFLERIGGVSTIKPRCVLIFGRSVRWNEAQHRACRIMNSSYHNLTVLTYDHVVRRARRMVGA